jgi:hypothetical protein
MEKDDESLQILLPHFLGKHPNVQRANAGGCLFIASNLDPSQSDRKVVLRFESWAEALMFLRRLDGNPSVDLAKVDHMVAKVEEEGLNLAISDFAEDRWGDSLPLLNEDLPDWLVESIADAINKEVDRDCFVLTLGDNIYEDCIKPKEEGCLLLHDFVEDAEEPTPLGKKSEWANKWGVDSESVEAILALQELCHNKDVATEWPEVAFVHYVLRAGIWLRPVPEALPIFTRLRAAKYQKLAQVEPPVVLAWLAAVAAYIQSELDGGFMEQNAADAAIAEVEKTGRFTKND